MGIFRSILTRIEIIIFFTLYFSIFALAFGVLITFPVWMSLILHYWRYVGGAFLLYVFSPVN